jgi:hypothetical protein
MGEYSRQYLAILEPRPSVGVEYRRMHAVTIRSLLVLIALLTVGQQQAAGQPGHESDCQFYATEKPAVYCDSIEVGYIVLAANTFTATLAVRFESKFFSGLHRLPTSDGWEFRNAGHRAVNYPAEFAVIIEPSRSYQLGESSPAPLSLPVVRLPPLRPRRIKVRWLDSRQRVLGAKSSELKQVVEPWSELREPRVWYRAKITGVNQPLASRVEVRVIGDGNTLLGTIRGKL